MHHCAEALSLFKQSQRERKSSLGDSWECFREAEGTLFAPSSSSVFSLLLAIHSVLGTQGIALEGYYHSPLCWCSRTALAWDGELWDGE